MNRKSSYERDWYYKKEQNKNSGAEELNKWEEYCIRKHWV